jgi:hypothetical protein
VFSVDAGLTTVVHRAVYKIRAVKCLVQEPFQSSFKFTSKSKFLVDGELRFQELDFTPSDPYRANHGGDGTYKSVGGPSFGHTGVIYCKCDHCTSLASRRALGAIKMNLPLTVLLNYHQPHFISTHYTDISKLQRLMNPNDTPFFMYHEAKTHHADPHPKRELRINGWEDGCVSGENLSDSWLTRRIEYKLKPGEVAKPGKVPRCIADLKVLASLAGFRVTKYMKQAMASMFYIKNGIRYVFCPSPSTRALREVFDQMLLPSERGYFVCFSDDSCLSIRIDGKIHRFNLDISSCDKSHTNSLFSLFRYVCPDRETADTLLKQCRAACRIYGITKGKPDRKRKAKLKPNGCFLYSGSTITTVINNLANFLIYLAITEIQGPVTTSSLIRAASLAGYLITVETCLTIQKVQFLKHSPAYDIHGDLQPLLNPGVLLRSAGRCNGDYPGKGP